MNRVLHVVLSAAMGVLGCTPVAPTPHPPRDAGRSVSPPPAESRPPMPSPQYTADAGPTACFPQGFRATRMRVMERYVELCGVVPGGGPRCFSVDPLAQHVGALPDRDTPDPTASAPGDGPAFEPPIVRTEISTHGARASTRGGTLTVTGGGGQARTVIPSAVAFHSLENAVLVPWAGGRQIALIGWRGEDLGSMTLIDPVTLRMQGKAAELPCDAH